MTPVTLPLASTEISRTYEFARISHRPVFSAIGIIVTAELDRARTWHPKPEHMPQCTHAARPMYGSEIIAIGLGTEVNPSFAAATSNNAPELLSGSGATGYGFDIGAKNGESTRRPEMPISHSACV